MTRSALEGSSIDFPSPLVVALGRADNDVSRIDFLTYRESFIVASDTQF